MATITIDEERMDEILEAVINKLREKRSNIDDYGFLINSSKDDDEYWKIEQYNPYNHGAIERKIEFYVMDHIDNALFDCVYQEMLEMLEVLPRINKYKETE